MNSRWWGSSPVKCTYTARDSSTVDKFALLQTWQDALWHLPSRRAIGLHQQDWPWEVHTALPPCGIQQRCGGSCHRSKQRSDSIQFVWLLQQPAERALLSLQCRSWTIHVAKETETENERKSTDAKSIVITDYYFDECTKRFLLWSIWIGKGEKKQKTCS